MRINQQQQNETDEKPPQKTTINTNQTMKKPKN